MRTLTRVRQIRQSKGLTQRDLSLRGEMPQSTISNVEKGTVSPRIETLSKLARALNVELSELIAV